MPWSGDGGAGVLSSAAIKDLTALTKDGVFTCTYERLCKECTLGTDEDGVSAVYTQSWNVTAQLD